MIWNFSIISQAIHHHRNQQISSHLYHRKSMLKIRSLKSCSIWRLIQAAKYQEIRQLEFVNEWTDKTNHN